MKYMILKKKISTKLPKMKPSFLLFYDYETTSCFNPIPTELCFIAISLENFKKCIEINSKRFPSIRDILNNKFKKSNHSKQRIELPRIMTKFLIPFNPGPEAMCDPAKKISRISSEDLTNEIGSFSEKSFDLIQTFLESFTSRQSLPKENQKFENSNQNICLVAHYGNKFDHIILSNFLRKKLDLNNHIFSDTIHTCDSLNAFRYIDKKFESEIQPKNDVIPESVSKRLFQPESPQKISKNSERNEKVDELLDFVLWNKKEDGMLSEIDLLSTPPKFRNREADAKKPFRSYSLSNVYQRLFDRFFPNAHTAECDVIAMIECCILYGSEFIDYVSQHSIPLKDIEWKKEKNENSK